MMNKSKFNQESINTSKRDFGKYALNKAYKKKNKKQFIRDYVMSLYGVSTPKIEESYMEEYENDAIMIEEAGGYYQHVIIGNKIPEGVQRIRSGFFIKTYTGDVTYTCKGYETQEQVLVVVLKLTLF